MGPIPTNNRERLALIRRLWRELDAARRDPEKQKALTEHIRQETDTYRRALDSDDPTKL